MTARARFEAGHNDKRIAAKLALELMALRRDLGEVRGSASSVLTASEVALAWGRPASAARLLAAVNAWLGRAGVPVRPSGRRRLESVQARIEAGLDAELIESAQTEGGTHIPVEAMDEAERLLGELMVPTQL